MSQCKHQHLVLLAAPDKKLRCRHCHLTLSESELEGDFCPECRAVHGVKRNDFEAVERKRSDAVRYGCETCGAKIPSETVSESPDE